MNKLQSNFNENSNIFIQENAFEKVVLKNISHFVSMCQPMLYHTIPGTDHTIPDTDHTIPDTDHTIPDTITC